LSFSQDLLHYLFAIFFPMSWECNYFIKDVDINYIINIVLIMPKKILILEDNKDVLSFFLIILNNYGYKAVGVESEIKALNEYKNAFENKTPFDAVILDLEIPGSNGAAETLKTLKKINPSIKAILTSGYSADPMMTNFKDFGFIGIIPKPFLIEDLFQLLTTILK
jgi:two-component system cell cycle sensor histidine kinase/response regulator CckA